MHTSVYRKATHSDRYLNFRSDHPIQHKRAVLNSLMNRSEALCSSEEEKAKERRHIKTALKANGYPDWFWRKTRQKIMTSAPALSKGLVVLPYFPGLTEKLKRCLVSYNTKVVIKPVRRLGDILTRCKDPIEPFKRLGVIYRILCLDCELSYVGETKRSMKARIIEHRSDVNNKHHDKSALAKHTVENNHRVDWDKWSILDYERNFHMRRFKESYCLLYTSPSPRDA